jgi:RecJ-like exonuclease
MTTMNEMYKKLQDKANDEKNNSSTPKKEKQISESAASTKKEKYAVTDENMLVVTEDFKKLQPSLLRVATEIRKAVLSGRPIYLSHHNDPDGFSAGILLERVIVSLIHEVHGEVRYLSNYFNRNPSRTPFYDVIDATKDISSFLMNMQRNKMTAPLIVITDNGSTKQDLAAIKKTKLYGADVVVIDHHDPGQLDEEGKSLVCHETLAHANPHLVGLSKNFSASMLCYQLAHFINEKHTPNVFTAALGGVADYCEGESIDKLVSMTGLTREYFKEFYVLVEFELFYNKFNLPKGSLYTLLEGTQKERDALVALYKPVFNELQTEVERAVDHFTVHETLGSTPAHFLDAEQVTFWSDFFTIGKVAGVAHRLFEDKGVSVMYSNQIIVFRAQDGIGFDVNKIVKELQVKLPYGRISGGGHNVAGSLKFAAGVQKEVLDFIKESISKL